MTVINGNPTNFSNLIEPKVFLDWIYRQNTQTNRFVQSGVLKNDPVLGGRLLQPGRTVEIPAMNDLNGSLNIFYNSIAQNRKRVLIIYFSNKYFKCQISS